MSIAHFYENSYIVRLINSQFFRCSFWLLSFIEKNLSSDLFTATGQQICVRLQSSLLGSELKTFVLNSTEIRTSVNAPLAAKF